MRKIIISTILLTGCAGFGQIDRVSDLNIEQLRRVNQVELLDKTPDQDYISLGKIKGLSCKGSAFSSASDKESALFQLKLKAIKNNANAILYPTCSHDASVDWGNNCWDSWVCIGEAISKK
jgi:hypothetical protein